MSRHSQAVSPSLALKTLCFANRLVAPAPSSLCEYESGIDLQSNSKRESICVFSNMANYFFNDSLLSSIVVFSRVVVASPCLIKVTSSHPLSSSPRFLLQVFSHVVYFPPPSLFPPSLSFHLRLPSLSSLCPATSRSQIPSLLFILLPFLSHSSISCLKLEARVG